MALTQLTQLQIAFKKLAGKSHTSPKLGVSNENLPSFIQLGNNTLFANPIPSTGLPSNLYQTSSGAIVEKIRFELVAFADGGYTPTNGTVLSNTSINAEGETTTNGNHTFVLKISGSYNSRSTNPKKGSIPFTDGYFLTGSNGTLQIVPPTFGSGYAVTLYTAAGVEIPPLSTIDWILDYSTGVLYAQDAPGDVTPGLIDAFIYIGKYQNDSTLGYTGSFSGSLQGTSSYSNQSLSSSYALTASYALNSGTTVDTGSFVTTSSFNSFTSSINTATSSFVTNSQTSSFTTTSSFNSFTASVNTFTSSYNTGSFTGSFTGSLQGTSSYSNQSLSSSYALTASYALNSGTTVDTGSLLTTASVNLNTITFTKGDGSTFPITVDTGSGGGGGGGIFPLSGSVVVTGSLEILSSGSNNIFTVTSASNTILQITNDNTGNLFEVNSPVGPSYSQFFYISSSGESEFLGLIKCSGSFSGSFNGSGLGLNNIPASSIVGLNLSRIASGSATASISPTTGFVTSTGEINGVFISEGSGSRTTNLVLGDSRALSVIVPGVSAVNGQNLIAIGSGSLLAATTTFKNIALGNNIMPLVTTNGSNNNIGIGFDVFTVSTNSLTNNIAIGSSASFGTTSGDNNIAIGTEALFSNTSQNNNIAIGLRAGKLATGAAASIFIGTDAGANVTSGDNNIAIGFEALKLLTSVGNNIAIGYQAMVSGSGAQDSIAIGSSALRNITTGDDNLAIGANALSSITTAAGNLAIGTDSMILTSATAASNNTSIGFQSLQNITGSNNVVLGYRTMQGFRSGSNNTIIGANNVSGSGVSGSNNTIIGANVVLPDGVYNNRIIIADGQGTQRISVSGSITSISGSLNVTGSGAIFTLQPQSPLPTVNIPTGSFAVSSSIPAKPYFWDGSVWNALY